MKAWALLCSGQGAQNAHMFALSQAYYRVEDWWQPLGSDTFAMPPLSSLLASTEDIFRNRYAQPLIAAASVANWLALQQCLDALANELAHPPWPAPSMVAGYSVGELSACAVAGMLTPAACVHLAAQRAAQMDACVTPMHAHAMAAISLPAMMPMPSALLQLGTVEIAIRNGECQWIIAGEKSAMLHAKESLLALGGSWQEVAVSVASHTSLMQAASVPFMKAMQGQTWAPARYPLLAGVSAQCNRAVDAVQLALQQQLTQTIQWAQCMDALVEHGVEVVLELGPGAALSKMLLARHPHLQVRSISQFRSMPGVAKWLMHQLEM